MLFRSLWAGVHFAGLEEGAKALAEWGLGSQALLNQGQDLVAGQGVTAARAVTEDSPDWRAFAALSGGFSRYNTGSHIDLSGGSLLAGLARGFEGELGRLTLGVFFEAGSGNFSTYNSFDSAASVEAEGNSFFYGGGILARLDSPKIGPGHIYAEVSGRIGQVSSDFASDDLRDTLGRKAEYDDAVSMYYGAHAALGYLWQLNEAFTLDVYGKYLWTRQEEKDLTLSTGDPIHLDAIDSHRVRGGMRLAYVADERVKPYIGAALEHEFAGEARATAYGRAIDSPSLVGSTVMGELGFSLVPVPGVPLSVDFGMQAYAGMREGVTGSVLVKFEF